MHRAMVAALAVLSSGCSALFTATGGYAHSISAEHAGSGGLALHGAVGAGGGARGDGAGMGAQLRYKQLDHAEELALGGHIYVLDMVVERTDSIFTTTSPWGVYGRFGVNLVEFESYEDNAFVSSLGPSLDLGMLMPLALTTNVSIERDVRFAGEPDETFVFLMFGLGGGAVGPF